MNTTRRLTKADARRILGLRSDYALAKWFPITPQAVQKWPDDEPIPELRDLQIRQRRPELFKAEQATA